MTSGMASYVSETQLSPLGHRYNGIFFAALGYRNGQFPVAYLNWTTSAAAYNLYGDYFTCEPWGDSSGRYARQFTFYNTTIYPINTNSYSLRLHGMPVMSVSEREP